MRNYNRQQNTWWEAFPYVTDLQTSFQLRINNEEKDVFQQIH